MIDSEFFDKLFMKHLIVKIFAIINVWGRHKIFERFYQIDELVVTNFFDFLIIIWSC